LGLGGARFGGPLEAAGQDAQRAPLAVCLQVEAGDEPLTRERGRAVVAVSALRGRLEDLEDLAEAEEALDAGPVPRLLVERRQEYATAVPRSHGLQPRGHFPISEPSSVFIIFPSCSDGPIAVNA